MVEKYHQTIRGIQTIYSGSPSFCGWFFWGFMILPIIFFLVIHYIHWQHYDFWVDVRVWFFFGSWESRNSFVRHLPINCTLCQSTFMVLLLATYTTKKCNAQLAITSTAQTLLDRHHLLVPLLEQQWRFWENESKNGSTCYFFSFLHT